jgi:hypothetical protein
VLKVEMDSETLANDIQSVGTIRRHSGE